MVGSVDELQRGRELHANHRWMAAYESLSAADQAQSLDADDLERLARAAYMVGRDDDYVEAHERAYRSHLDAGRPLRAVRCAFWIWLNLAPRGEEARATGWLGRAQRLLERRRSDCAERGYLLIPDLLRCVARGDCDEAYAIATAGVGIAERFADADLLALVLMEQGHALIRQGEVDAGLRLVDEVLVALTTRELSPVVTGIVYCNTIAFCRSMYELRRAREWTEALTRWCEQQPEMMAYTGVCLVHRAELMELQGAWPAALAEARRAGERARFGVLNHPAAGHALYRQGEVHRLRGDLEAAEAHYREATRRGWEPQPGLALVRLAQGRTGPASAAIRRVVSETEDPLQRARLLPAYVEIMLACGDVGAARDASDELAAIARHHRSAALSAMSAHAQGAVALSENDPRGALGSLRAAWQVWQELDAPYEAARVRVLVGLACRALGDEDTARLELEVARAALARLGAARDLAGVDGLIAGPATGETGGLTARELQVLRLVAGGMTNKAIADELVLSERTIDRHVSNIFTKLGVSSRAAATAHAYEHRVV